MKILIVGVGGQGVLLSSKLLGLCALDAGYQVRTAETIGMAQRGGSVQSHITFGEGALSPLIPLGRADLIIAFDPDEGARAKPYASEACHIVSAGDLDASKLANQKSLNVALVGAAMRHLPFGKDAMLDALRQTVRPDLYEANAAALEYGMS
jgi:indolepyruvate ferredoxin oxidoreductase beta subunit